MDWVDASIHSSSRVPPHAAGQQIVSEFQTGY